MTALAGYTLAFDLDGTLVDTIGDIHRSLNHVLTREGAASAALSDVRAWVGLGARNLLMRAFAAGGVEPDPARLDRLTECYIAANAADIAGLSAPFPGVADALDSLLAHGARLCVCTNKQTDLSIRLLGALGLENRFAAIVGGDQPANRKPHPDHFIHAIRAAGGEPSRSLMVGDSRFDVDAARAAGAPVAVYALGYTDTAPELLGADAVFRHFDELPDLVVSLLRPQPTPRT